MIGGGWSRPSPPGWCRLPAESDRGTTCAFQSCVCPAQEKSSRGGDPSPEDSEFGELKVTVE